VLRAYTTLEYYPRMRIHASRKKQQRVKRPKKTSTQLNAEFQQFKLYHHQQRAKQKIQDGIKRMFLGWHRRAGKDATAMDIIKDLMKERIGMYWHMFPFHAQARRAIWEGIDGNTGERFLDRYFPIWERTKVNQTDMLINMEGGSSYQLLGSDNYERMIGADPVCVVFSEWAQCDPNAWTYIRPILTQNNGIAIFITTFRGRNHAWKLYELVKNMPGWHAEVLTIDDTERHDGTPIITPEDVEKEVREGMSRELAQQEFYCNPLSINEGAYFRKQYEALPTRRIVSADQSFQCAAWHFGRDFISATVYQPLVPAINAIHTFETVEFSTAMDRFRAHHPHAIHHIAASNLDLFTGVSERTASIVEVSSELTNRQGRVGWLLNQAALTEGANMSLTDVLMEYTRDNVHKNDEVPAIAAIESLAVAAQHIFTRNANLPSWGRPVDYSRQDKAII